VCVGGGWVGGGGFAWAPHARLVGAQARGRGGDEAPQVCAGAGREGMAGWCTRGQSLRVGSKAGIGGGERGRVRGLRSSPGWRAQAAVKVEASHVLASRCAAPAPLLTRPPPPLAAELRYPLCLVLLRNCSSPYEQALTAAVRLFEAILSAQVGHGCLRCCSMRLKVIPATIGGDARLSCICRQQEAAAEVRLPSVAAWPPPGPPLCRPCAEAARGAQGGAGRALPAAAAQARGGGGARQPPRAAHGGRGHPARVQPPAGATQAQGCRWLRPQGVQRGRSAQIASPRQSPPLHAHTACAAAATHPHTATCTRRPRRTSHPHSNTATCTR
jgi:hypothetical protein